MPVLFEAKRHSASGDIVIFAGNALTPHLRRLTALTDSHLRLHSNLDFLL